MPLLGVNQSKTILNRLIGGVRIPPINPYDYATHWFSADFGTFQDSARTIPAINNDELVKGWTDRSVSQKHGTQTVDANSFLLKTNMFNGLPMLYAPDSIRRFIHTYSIGSNPSTIYMVYYPTITDANKFQYVYSSISGISIMACGTTGGGSLWGFLMNQFGTRFTPIWASLVNNPTITAVITRNYNDIDAVHGGLYGSTYSGVSWPTLATVNTIGGMGNNTSSSIGMQGYIGEIIVCPSAHDTNTVNRFGKYLSKKWGLPFQLSGKSSPPVDYHAIPTTIYGGP